MNLGSLNQTQSGIFNAAGWQLIGELEVSAISSATKLSILGDSLTDASGKSVSAVGTAAASASQYKFSQLRSSIFFDGNSDYLTLADSADWNFGSGDFTIDTWARWSTIPGDQVLIAHWGDAPNNSWNCYFGNSIVYFYYSTTGSTATSFAFNWTPTVNTWYHLAFVRSGNSFKFYVNGTQVGDTKDMTGITLYDSPSQLWIGNTSSWGAYFNGYMSGIRITKGTALWTSDFTVPTYSEYGGARTVHSFIDLNGDADIEYKLVSRIVSGGTSATFYLRPNNDSGSNYGYQQMAAVNTTIAPDAATSYTGYPLVYNTSNSGELLFNEAILYAQTGASRVVLMRGANKISTTTVSDLNLLGGYWNNTADNITSLAITSNVTNGLAIGTHLLLFRRCLSGSVATSGMRFGNINVKGSATLGEMSLISRYEVTGSAVSGYTFTGLNGNVDTLYEIRVYLKSGEGTGGVGIIAQLNSDTTDGHYGCQWMWASGTSKGGSRFTYMGLNTGASEVTINNLSLAEVLLYAKSGFVRTSLSAGNDRFTGTTATRILRTADSWNNTADNITSIKITHDSPSAHTPFGVGSVIELWAIRKKL